MIEALTIGEDEFDYLTIGNFVQGTPDREEDEGGPLDSNLLDEEKLDD